MFSNVKNIDDISVSSMTLPMTSHRIISEITSTRFLLPKMVFHCFELSLSPMFKGIRKDSVEDTSLAGPVQFHTKINKYINMVCCRLSVHDRKVAND